MEKVLLNKQEIEALESALEINGGDKASVIHWHAQNLWDGKREVLNDQDLDLIIRALYVGYELEASAEDKVREYYDYLVILHGKDIGSIIKNTIDILEVKIQGINC